MPNTIPHYKSEGFPNNEIGSWRLSQVKNKKEVKICYITYNGPICDLHKQYLKSYAKCYEWGLVLILLDHCFYQSSLQTVTQKDRKLHYDIYLSPQTQLPNVYLCHYVFFNFLIIDNSVEIHFAFNFDCIA